jgi:hypothetical protein
MHNQINSNYNNVLEPFLNVICAHNNALSMDLYNKLNTYLFNSASSQLNSLDLVKFFDATCLYLKSTKASQSADCLILIQLFIQNMIELLEPYIDESKIIYF